MRPERGARGFSLIEVMVAVAMVSILAGALAPMTLRQVTATRRERALAEMQRLLEGMVGRPASEDDGYVGDMGGLPAALSDLNDATGHPARVVDPNDGVGYGWSGPYAPRLVPSGGSYVDPWGRPYVYDGATPQLRSAGPDRVSGNADDLVHPPVPPPLVGDLTVTVIGLPSGGGPPEQLEPARVDVYVASSLGGVRNESAMGGPGPFSATGLHVGHHGVRAEGRGAWTGAVVRDVIQIGRGTHALRLVLEQP